MKKVKSAQHVAIVQWFIDLGDDPGITRRKLVRGPVRGPVRGGRGRGVIPISTISRSTDVRVKKKT